MPLLLHGFLERSAERRPAALAVVDGERSLTYRELDEQANQVAHLLGRLGVVRGATVAHYFDKSLEAVIAIYGILKSGAAYVPFDPKAPAARLARIAATSGVEVMVAGASRRKRWDELLDGAPRLRAIVCLDSEPVEPPPTVRRFVDTGAAAEESPLSPRHKVDESDTAYVLFTSGSTGAPKGVVLSHRNGGWFARWAAEALDLKAHDRLSNHAPFHFDLSTFDLFAAAYVGTSVHLVPPSLSMFPMQLAEFIRNRRLTVWYSVPTVLRALSQQGGLDRDGLPDLRAVVFAGEVFPVGDLRDLMNRLPAPSYWNWYGPTETNVCTAHAIVGAPGDGEIPIGEAIDGVTLLVVDEVGNEAAQGVPGELYVAGPTVTSGYFGDPERSATVLVPSPVDATDTRTFYRTGDMVRRRPDGALDFIGRRDDQVKSRGYRIELGEVESIVQQHPAVMEAAVVAIPDPAIGSKLVAFVSLRPGAETPEVARFCRDRLPEYMVPTRVRSVDALPRTSNDKVDRVSLRSMAAST